MTLRKSTRYALHAAVELARAGAGGQVTVTRVAERYAIPATVLAKVFQQLARAGIVVGSRGAGGGYALARQPSEVTALDVIDIFEPPGPRGRCLLAGDGAGPCAVHGACRLRWLFDEVDDRARSTLASATLVTLAGTHSRRAPSPRPEP